MPLMSLADGQLIVGPHFGELFNIISGSWKEYMTDYSTKQRATHCATTRAGIVHDITVERASRYFSEIDDGDVHNLSGLILFTLRGEDDLVAIRFKKFDRQLTTRNQPTHQVRDFKRQQQIDALGHAYHLEAGYVLSKDELEVQQYCLVCPNDNDVFWDIELTATDSVTKVRDMFEAQPMDDKVDIVRPKVPTETQKHSAKDDAKDK
jgi:hypothetical protein